MSQNEIKLLLEELLKQQQKEPVAVKHDVIDGLSKVGIALCTAGIIWVASQIQAQDRKLVEIESNQKHIALQVETFRTFTEKPRFTRDDFILEMKLYDRRLQSIESELKYRSEFMSETSKRLERLE